jgi:two-component system CheB/CheR fusion protein
VADTHEIATPEDAGELPEFPVVGIGASAGGLESLERLFSEIPVDTGMAFVVLQHLSPDFKSVMDELLARRTSMPVRNAAHDTPLEPNAVYLLPPMKEMQIKHRRLLLSDKDPRHGLTLPIDTFFRSLAADVGERAIAVVLSGSGSDGSRGILEVNKAGGVVFCESVDTAKFNGMPLSAIRTGIVDRVLTPEEIAQAIAALARGGLPHASEDSGMQEGADAILELLRGEYGIDFSHYKTSTVHRRIERRLALNRSLDLDAYVEQLRSDPRELNSLYEDLLIGVTRFFRDDQSFQILEERVIPEIVSRAKVDPDLQIRVWVPGCATGQEAYSIAILFSEQLVAMKKSINVKILATDVHKASLDFAGAGLYNEQQVADINPERRDQFFTRRQNGYQVSQALREMIVFAPHNVIRDAPFTKLDLITCRNLLIYFQPHAQKTVLTLFHFALKPGGYLFLGSSESPRGLVEEFDTIDEHGKVYRKRRDIGLPRDLKLPLPRGGAPMRMPSLATSRSTGVSADLLATYDRLLDRFMPPSFLVDENGALVDSYGGVEAMLKVKPRRPAQSLVEMLSDDLRMVISGALHRVKRDQESVRYEGLLLPGVGRYALVATPLRDSHGNLAHILFSLEGPEPFETKHRGEGESQPAEVANDRGVTVQHVEAVDLANLSRDQLHALQDELSYTKENLQAAIQELETTNEELQATNEELIASNEELQSTNEELHSVNEELYTVNAEYQKKNVELQELNDDMEHLLNGTDVGTMFLDRTLSIRKFTPRIGDVFRIIPDDVGRPLRSFSHDLLRPTLMADIEHVLQSGESIEEQTWDTRGRCYFLRILPYIARPRDNRESQAPSPIAPTPDGVLVTLTDMSALEQARSRLAQLSAIVESSEDAIAGVTFDGIVTSWNRGATKLYGYNPDDAIGRHVSFIYPDGRKDEVLSVLSQVRAGMSIEPLETTRLRKDGSLVDVSVSYSPILDGTHDVVGVSAIARDITQLVRTRQEVAEREERIRLLLDSTAEAIYGTDLSGVCTFCNAACAKLLGYDSPAALIGTQIHRLIHHTKADGMPFPADQSPIYIAMRHREPAHVDDDILWRADGTSFPAEYWCHPIVREGEVIGAVVTFIDITVRRRAEEELQEGVRRREQFLAMLSHELRNPLAAILSATHLLDRSTITEDVCYEAGRVIARQARHMSRLLDDLLDVSRITRGRITLHKEHIDLRETSRSAIEALGPLMRERKIDLDVDISDQPVPVFGDAARLQQIQANLLSNATKYSPPGSRVKFEVRRERNEAMIRVSDHGRGIEPELLPKIFDLFVQGPQTIARSDGGLGIGLTLLRSLVQLHDGRVEAVSDGPDKGSVFTVWLPSDQASLSNSGRPVVSTPPQVKTVVVVEDQEDARTMMQILLESKGLTVSCADNGEEGLKLIEKMKPDLAIVDLGLPVMSGFELARAARANSAIASIPLIALSGYGQESDVKAALEAGFDTHLTKPPDFDRLDELINRVRRRT